MSKFKVGDKVVASDRAFSGQDGWPNGVVESFDGASYQVRFSPGAHTWTHFEKELTLIEGATTHYTPDSTGKDYLARCEDTFSREEMIGAYRFTLGKYVDRMGKKTGEPVEKELAKIIDYATRAKAWLERS